MKYFVNVFGGLLLVAASACSQQTGAPVENVAKFEKVIPGGPQLTAGRLEDGAFRYVKPGGQMNIEVGPADYKGRPVLETRVWFNQPAGGPDPDTIRVDPETYGFVSRRLAMRKYVIEVEFTEDNRFAGSLTPTQGSDFSPRVYDKAYPHNGFEPSVLFLWIPALPLEVGYKASIPTFDLNNGSQMIWANIEVVGRETVTIGGRRFDTLKVVSDGIRKKTMWIAPDFPYPVKMATSGAPGVWKLDL